MKPLLFVMNPRQIKRAILSISALDIDRVWFANMYERDLISPMSAAVEAAAAEKYTHILLLADDTAPTQTALDLVLRGLSRNVAPIVTAYCNLDKGSPYVNLTKTPFADRRKSRAHDYDWMTREEVEGSKEKWVKSEFAGACLTGYSVDLWRRFPFRPNILHKGSRGNASDWNFCIRTQDAGVPIIAPRGAFVHHLKGDWEPLLNNRKSEGRLLVGVRPPRVRWDIQRKIKR